MDPQLPGILGSLAPVLGHYGYLAVIGVVLVESFGVPAPGQTILIAAGIYGGAGRLNIFTVGALGFLAAVGGDSVGYAIGYYGGRRLVLRFGRFIFVTEKRLDTAEAFFARHGGKIVAAARFVDGLRQVNGIVAGMVQMPWRRFLAFNALGAAVWAGLWTSVGYLAGDHIIVIYEEIHRYQTYVLVALGALVLAVVIRLLWHRRRKRLKAG